MEGFAVSLVDRRVKTPLVSDIRGKKDTWDQSLNIDSSETNRFLHDLGFLPRV